MNSILNINRYVSFMYLIIIEGTDNIGKDTLISRLIEDFETVTLIHCGSPKCICFTSHEQDIKFIKYANNSLLEICNAYKLNYVNLYDIFKNNKHLIYNLNNHYPNQDGYKLIANEIIKSLKIST